MAESREHDGGWGVRSLRSRLWRWWIIVSLIIFPLGTVLLLVRALQTGGVRAWLAVVAGLIASAFSVADFRSATGDPSDDGQRGDAPPP
ncbi:MAG TPA: hypothetical protein VK891_05115 [Euzebyales bacterium]|nr:hypothetical protein [Euzebyales bacterium]